MVKMCIGLMCCRHKRFEGRIAYCMAEENRNSVPIVLCYGINQKTV